MSEKTITITEKQFQEAIMKANEEWISIGEGTGKSDPMKNMMMGVHNMMFGHLIAKTLFVESEDKE